MYSLGAAVLFAADPPNPIVPIWQEMLLLLDGYYGYSSTVSTLMGGLPGRLTRLQEEMKK